MSNMAKKVVMLLFAIVIIQGCSYNTGKHSEGFYNQLGNCSVEILANGQMQVSGAFVSPDGYILTVAHFIPQPETKLEVIFGNSHRIDAELAAIDRGNDLALLKIQTQHKLPYLSVTARPNIVGENIYVIGSPLYKHKLAFQGNIISSESRYNYLGDNFAYVNINFIQTMTPRGFSGGCWVNSDCEIAGVQSGFINDKVSGGDGHTNAGIAFIVRPEIISSFIELKQHSNSPSMGGNFEELWTQSPGFQNRFPAGTEGIVIHQLRAAGPLEKSGFVREDLIIEADGKKVRYLEELLDIVNNHKPYDTIRLCYIKPDNMPGGIKEVTLDCLTQNWLKTKQ